MSELSSDALALIMERVVDPRVPIPERLRNRFGVRAILGEEGAQEFKFDTSATPTQVATTTSSAKGLLEYGLNAVVSYGLRNRRSSWNANDVIPTNPHHLNDPLSFFKSAYLLNLSEQVKWSGKIGSEFGRTLWLDGIRWLGLYRLSSFSRYYNHLREFVLQYAELFYSPLYNPYCNFSMTFGLGCTGCPLVKYQMVPAPMTFGKESLRANYLHCLFDDPLTSWFVNQHQIVEAVTNSRVNTYAGYGVANADVYTVCSEILRRVREEVCGGRAVRIYASLAGVRAPRRRKIIEAVI
jgi:hypothetical protein